MTLARIATCLADLLVDGDILYLADDDQQAQAIYASLAVLMPGHPVVYLPSSDALPGDVTPASPANVGMRVAACTACAVCRRKRIGIASPSS